MQSPALYINIRFLVQFSSYYRFPVRLGEKRGCGLSGRQRINSMLKRVIKLHKETYSGLLIDLERVDVASDSPHGLTFGCVLTGLKLIPL